MPCFVTVKTSGELAIESTLLAVSIPLSKHIDVHVDYLVVHSAWGIGGVVAESGLEMKAIKEITPKGGRIGEDCFLSTLSSHVPIYFTGRVDPILDRILGWSFLVIDFIHDLWI